MTDEELVILVQKGDWKGFGELVSRYENKLKRYIRRLINQSDEEVEDMVSNIFIKAYENIQSFDNRYKFGSWIYRIAHNTGIDYFKNEKSVLVLTDDSDELVESEEKLIEELEIEKESKYKLMLAIERLEIKYKEVILLYFFDNKSYEEISDILHISVTNVGVILKRAKEKLKKILNSKL